MYFYLCSDLPTLLLAPNHAKFSLDLKCPPDGEEERGNRTPNAISTLVLTCRAEFRVHLRPTSHLRCAYEYILYDQGLEPWTWSFRDVCTEGQFGRTPFPHAAPTPWQSAASGAAPREAPPRIPSAQTPKAVAVGYRPIRIKAGATLAFDLALSAFTPAGHTVCTDVVE